MFVQSFIRHKLLKYLYISRMSTAISLFSGTAILKMQDCCRNYGDLVCHHQLHVIPRTCMMYSMNNPVLIESKPSNNFPNTWEITVRVTEQVKSHSCPSVLDENCTSRSV